MANYKVPFQFPQSAGEGSRNAATQEAWIQRLGSSVYRENPFTVAAGSNFITYDTLIWVDNPQVHTAPSSLARYRALQDGLYEVHARVDIVDGGGTVYIISVVVEAGAPDTIRGDEKVAPTGQFVTLQVHGYIRMRKGDRIGIVLNNVAGTGGVTIGSSTPSTSYFQVTRLGPHPDDTYR